MAMFGLIGIILVVGFILGALAGLKAQTRQIESELRDGECKIGRCTYLVTAVEFELSGHGSRATGHDR